MYDTAAAHDTAVTAETLVRGVINHRQSISCIHHSDSLSAWTCLENAYACSVGAGWEGAAQGTALREIATCSNLSASCGGGVRRWRAVVACGGGVRRWRAAVACGGGVCSNLSVSRCARAGTSTSCGSPRVPARGHCCAWAWEQRSPGHLSGAGRAPKLTSQRSAPGGVAGRVAARVASLSTRRSRHPEARRQPA